MKRPSQKYRQLLMVIGFVLIALSSKSYASPALIQAGDSDLRNDLRWLQNRGVIQLSTSSWPLPYQAVMTALSHARITAADDTDRMLVQRLTRTLENQYGKAFSGQLGMGVSSMPLPMGGFSRNTYQKDSQQLTLASSSASYAVSVSINHSFQQTTHKAASTTMEGSYAAREFWGQTVYIGQLNHWWGPGNDGSLQWSDAATPILGVGITRSTEEAPTNKYLVGIGPWGYEIFLGRLMHDSAAPGTRILGARIHISPVAGLEVGASRIFEWGGRGADAGFSNFTDSLLGNGNNDSTGGSISNEVAGFDIQYTASLYGNPLTAYAQIIGEDEAGKLPYQLSSLIGLRYQSRLHGVRIISNIECADTMANRLFSLREGTPGVTYRHDTFYRDGFYHDGMPIGYFTGGDSSSTALSLAIIPSEAPNAFRYQLRYIHASLNDTSQSINQRYPTAETISQLELGVSASNTIMAIPVRWSATVSGRHGSLQGYDTSGMVHMTLSL